MIVAPAVRPIRIGAFSLTGTEMLVEGDASIDDYVKVGAFIKSVYQASAWWAVDWVSFSSSRREFAVRQAQVIAATGYAIKTVYNLRWLGANVPRVVRRNDLSVSAHVEVAPLPLSEQLRWLEIAARDRLSVRVLRSRIRANF